MYSDQDDEGELTDKNAYQLYNGAKSVGAASNQMANKVDLKNMAGKQEQLFFEFFGMYTKESIKS